MLCAQSHRNDVANSDEPFGTKFDFVKMRPASLLEEIYDYDIKNL
jgi:hypothetical protein